MLRAALNFEPQERRGVALSFALFFTLMCGYSILKPLRDEMAVVGGTKSISLALMFTFTFGAMVAAVPLYSALVARFPRQKVIPYVYRFFLVCLFVFFALMKLHVAPRTVAFVFFVWVSVYNLFVVSVFWSFMADLFGTDQGRRLFGLISGGGTAGAVVGLGLTALFARVIGPVYLLLFSAALLYASQLCVDGLSRWSHATSGPTRVRADVAEKPMGGSVFAGFWLLLRSPFLLALGAQTLLYTATSTFLYFHQQKIVVAAVTSSAERTSLFATIELSVQLCTLVLQMTVTGRFIDRMGLAVALAVAPIITGLGFLGLATAPTLAVLIAFKSVRGAAHYSIDRPAREVLFTSVDREEKYKAKSFIDTAIYRGSDLASGWLYTGLGEVGLGLQGIAVMAVPFAALWLGVALFLARRQSAEAARPQVISATGAQ